MHFRIGTRPFSEDFDAAEWTRVRSPAYNWFAPRVGVTVGVLLAVGLLVLCWLLIPQAFAVHRWRPWQLVLVLLFTIPVHELVHALLQPNFGRDTVLGFSPRRMAFYAFYPGPLSRRRTLIGAIGPFLVLSVAPLAAAAMADAHWWGTMALVVINGASSSNDLVSFFFVLSRVPPGAEITHHAGRGYFRLPDRQQIERAR